MRSLPRGSSVRLGTLLLVVGLVVAGCGGSGGEESQTAEAVKWVVVQRPFDAEPRGSVIFVGVGTGWCGPEFPSIDRVAILQRRPRIVLAAYVRYSRTPSRGSGSESGGAKRVPFACPEEEAGLSAKVRLAEPVGARPIYDAFRTPPVKRWPQ